MNRIIIPPAEDDVKAEHRALYVHRNMKSVAAHAGASPTTYSRQRNADETLTRNPVWEVLMEFYGAKVTNQEEIGKGVFKMIYDYAVELGLVDEQPVDILKLANDRIKSITKEQIDALAADELTVGIADASELEGSVNDLKSALIAARRMQSTIRDFELDDACVAQR